MNTSRLVDRLSNGYCYKAAKGATFNDDDAQIIGSEIERMQMRGCDVTPETLVSAAKSALSPLHRYFEWDDTKAAHAFRKEQARGIVNHLIVVSAPDENDRCVQVKGHLSVVVTCPETQEAKKFSEYISVIRVQEEPLLRDQVKQQGLKELRGWVEKYKSLDFDEFAPIYTAADLFLK